MSSIGLTLSSNASSTSALNRLGQGLSIAAKQEEAAAIEGGDSKSINERFVESLKERLVASGMDEETAKAIAEEIAAAAVEIGETYGQDKANEFMSEVLAATSEDSEKGDLAATLENFTEPLSDLSAENPDLRQQIQQTLNNLKEAEATAKSETTANLSYASSSAVTSVSSYSSQSKLGNLVNVLL